MSDRAPHTLAVAYPSAVPRRMTGMVELDLAEAAHSRLPRPSKVSAVLEAMFAEVGGVAMRAGLTDVLATGARAWLLLRTARVFFGNQGWFTAPCGVCQQPFDLSVDLASVPKSAPGAAFPVITVKTSLGPRRFEVPNGRTEAALAQQADLRVLAAVTGLAPDAGSEADQFTSEDLIAIETALDDATPDVAEEITSSCPACGGDLALRLDPLDFAFPKPERIDRDVYLLARTYGWDEPTILAMPTSRRRRHAQMIASTGGPKR
ncbi:hypothetical protein [Shimia ponticola]|uniref:hypothetical protein n=1 Tax=Shimia ponticola TaxID=2582893 RepID=UPI0011BE5247|nr:hypothetical protein [Shimia ponticola]